MTELPRLLGEFATVIPSAGHLRPSLAGAPGRRCPSAASSHQPLPEIPTQRRRRRKFRVRPAGPHLHSLWDNAAAPRDLRYEDMVRYAREITAEYPAGPALSLDPKIGPRKVSSSINRPYTPSAWKRDLRSNRWFCLGLRRKSEDNCASTSCVRRLSARPDIDDEKTSIIREFRTEAICGNLHAGFSSVQVIFTMIVSDCPVVGHSGVPPRLFL